MTLKEINEKYERILHSNMSDEEKDKSLSELMTRMEKEFKIPIMQNKEWEKENRAVTALYRKISKSRTTI